MTEVVNVPKGKLRIFACGGAGMNIGALLEKHRGQDEIAFAEIDIVYIDTSVSNMRSHIDQSHCYLLDGMDGSGKLRAENHVEIGERVRAILQKFRPMDFNIVLHSAAGGSGSVIGPLLTRELLSNGVPTIVLTIGSADTRLDTENTLKTLKSYESIANMVKAPVVMSYVQNSQTTSRTEADDIMFNMIISLAVLFSRGNRELDSKDLFNWLRFDRVTTFPVQLASLTMIEGQSAVIGKDLGNIISVATLASDGESTSLMEMPEYQCVGYLPAEAKAPVLSKAPFHFIITDGLVSEICKHLQKILTSLEQSQAARLRRAPVLSEKDKLEDSGLAL